MSNVLEALRINIFKEQAADKLVPKQPLHAQYQAPLPVTSGH